MSVDICFFVEVRTDTGWDSISPVGYDKNGGVRHASLIDWPARRLEQVLDHFPDQGLPDDLSRGVWLSLQDEHCDHRRPTGLALGYARAIGDEDALRRARLRVEDFPDCGCRQPAARGHNHLSVTQLVAFDWSSAPDQLAAPAEAYCRLAGPQFLALVLRMAALAHNTDHVRAVYWFM